MFLSLAGKRAIVAGGSAAAAWKAELLAAAGADVHVYAKDVSPEMEALLARGAAAERRDRGAREELLVGGDVTEIPERRAEEDVRLTDEMLVIEWREERERAHTGRVEALSEYRSEIVHASSIPHYVAVTM